MDFEQDSEKILYNKDGEVVDTFTGLTQRELEELESERTMFGESEANMAQRMFRQNVLGAVRSVTNIALHSSNEKLRYQASVYIIERNLGRIQDNPPTPPADPIQALLDDVLKQVTYDENPIDVSSSVASTGKDATTSTGTNQKAIQPRDPNDRAGKGMDPRVLPWQERVRKNHAPEEDD